MQTCRDCDEPIRFVKVRQKNYPCDRGTVDWNSASDPGSLYGLIAQPSETLPFVVGQYTTLGDLRNARLIRVHRCRSH